MLSRLRLVLVPQWRRAGASAIALGAAAGLVSGVAYPPAWCEAAHEQGSVPKAASQPSLMARCIAEAVGTGLIIQGGCGVVCAAKYAGSGVGTFGLAAVWGANVCRHVRLITLRCGALAARAAGPDMPDHSPPGRRRGGFGRSTAAVPVFGQPNALGDPRRWRQALRVCTQLGMHVHVHMHVHIIPGVSVMLAVYATSPISGAPATALAPACNCSSALLQPQCHACLLPYQAPTSTWQSPDGGCNRM